jgi:hypothetical protein
MDDNSHILTVTKSFSADPFALYNYLKSLAWLRLTGADDIKIDWEKRSFTLTFNERGIITGRILVFTEPVINIEWNVKGFHRPDELNTLVEISLSYLEGGCFLNLTHTNLISQESVDAKKRAWLEILNEITVP